MSLYTKNLDDEPEKDSKDILIATCEIDDTMKNVFWTENMVKDKVLELHCKNAEPCIIKQKNQIYSCYIAGASGSGKSTYASMICKKLLKLDKSIEYIFFITAQTVEDTAFKKLYKLKRKYTQVVKKNGKLMDIECEEPVFNSVDIMSDAFYQMPLEEFKNSIILFDDYECLPGPIEKKLILFQRSVITMGRKLNINPIIIRHVIQNFQKTKEILTECQHVVLYPRFNIRDTSKFLESYMSFDKEEIKEVRGLNTRALYIRKVIPNFFISNELIKLF